ncbi:MAG: lamin tail domain-containing protein, partial [Acidobacteriota bacterium]
GAGDEFVELYNNSDGPFDIGGWKIRSSSSTGTVTTRVTIVANTIIPPRGHFLASSNSNYSGAVIGDQTYSAGIADNGGIAITDPTDAISDQVGMDSGSAYKEGSVLSPFSSSNTTDRSYERKPGGAIGSTQDTNDNSNDFQLITPGLPQNLASSPTPGPSPTATPTPSPTPTPTPTPTPSPTPTPTPTPTPSPMPTPTPSPSPSPSPSTSPSPSPSPSPVAKVVISQIYGGGGNSGATLKNDFIEVFNSGNQTVSLTGWSIQVATATGSTWSVTNLTAVSLAPGQYYLIQEAAGAGGTTNLPTPDATGTINISATASKVALVNSTTALAGSCPTGAGIQDFIGYGLTANCFEGTGPTPTPSNTTAVLRNGNGCTDNNQNSTDFTAGAPNPRNTGTAASQCPGTLAPEASFDFDLLWSEVRFSLQEVALTNSRFCFPALRDVACFQHPAPNPN